MTDLIRLSAAELAAKIVAKEASSVEVTQACLDQIERTDGDYHAFLHVAGEQALATAADIDKKVSAGEELPSALAGVPLALKDVFTTTDMPTTCGSKILQGWTSPYDATVTARLRAAGIPILGKTNMDEFAMGSSTENSAFGPTRNPHDPTRVPGGSSGGSAAAVAAGLVPAALGSDTGGSVRQPAAFCGVVGIKPTYGRVSRYGLVGFASSLDQVGTFGRTVYDATLLLRTIAGPDPLDSTAAAAPVPDWLADLDAGAEGLVVGVPREFFPPELDPRIARLCHDAAERLAAAGAEVREVSLPHTEYAISTYYVIAPAEASSNLARYDGVRYGLRAPGADSAVAVYEATRSLGFGAEVKRRIMLGTYVLSAGYYDEYYGTAQRVRGLIARDFREVFATGVDVLLTPTTPSVAFRLGEKLEDPYQMYLADIFTVTANLAGVPALSLPIGTVDGLPVGGQLIADRWQEGVMVRAAAALERAIVG